MPKKSKKSKSKRVTLRQKYKVLRKVREHHRKKRKEAKKNGSLRKAPKDPGIPNAWPFKDELINQLKAQKERAIARERALRDAARARAELASEEGEGRELQDLQQEAQARRAQFERQGQSAGSVGGGVVDYSLKAFYRDFARVVEASDVIIEVIDARDPGGTRCVEVERFVRRMGPSKRIVLLMNKIDLVPREVAQAWLKYFREEIPAVAFKCSTQQQATNLGHRALSTAKGSSLSGSECLGAETLLQLLKNYSRAASSGLKKSITVGVIGLPNVGKSSLINSLKRTKVAQVGNMPGITRSVQEVHLDKQVTLLDSPGVVFADVGADGAAAAALRNCVKVSSLEDPLLPLQEVVRRCPKKQLMRTYNIPVFKDADEFIHHVAASRGKLRKGGTVDAEAAARIVLQDWNDGKIQYYTMPPQRHAEVEGTTALVADWGADFNPDEVFAAEENAVIAGLPSLDDAKNDFFETKSVGEVRIHLNDDAQMSDSEQGDDTSNQEDSLENENMEQSMNVTKMQGSRDVQNAKLYEELGQYNPHAARSERKRRKKHGTNEGLDLEENDSDYDFDEDWGDGVATANAFSELAEASDDDSVQSDDNDDADMED